jgi:hypothetical protein
MSGHEVQMIAGVTAVAVLAVIILRNRSKAALRRRPARRRR